MRFKKGSWGSIVGFRDFQIIGIKHRFEKIADLLSFFLGEITEKTNLCLISSVVYVWGNMLRAGKLDL